MSSTSSTKEIHVNAFDMNCVGHIQQGLWRHPRDQSSSYLDVHYWTDYAKKLEAGLFDGVFFADVVGVYDVYGASPDAAVRGAVQVPVNDPTLIIPAMAAATTHLGFGVTANLTYESPFLFARRMSTLDHLTRGRIGWNIVTGYLDSAARAAGFTAQSAHDDRYDLADEYMELVYKLWEGSWEDGAVRATAPPACMPIRPRCTWCTTAASSTRSTRCTCANPRCSARRCCTRRARRRAAGVCRHARRVRVRERPVQGRREEHRRRHPRAGRGPRPAAEDIKVFLGATIVTGRTDAEAQDKFEDYQRYVSSEAALVHAAASMGIDLAKFDIDEPVETGRRARPSSPTSRP
jgi:alkanesulfonate monooxygenase SsuD/methylene tetrahydromethanopterin reductase-like flavin-dependent oxidoreductase (luciferase family)